MTPLRNIELTKVIHEFIKKNDVTSRIEDAIESKLQNLGIDQFNFTNGELLEKIKTDDIVDQLVNEVRENFCQLENSNIFHEFKEGESYTPILNCNFIAGRAFLDFLDANLTGDKGISGHFIANFCFGNQRHESKPTECKCEPLFKETFSFRLPSIYKCKSLNRWNPAHLVSISEPIRIILIKTDTIGSRSLISSHYLDWRQVLVKPNRVAKFNVELFGVGCERDVTAGIIELELKLDIPTDSTTIPEDILKAQLELENSTFSENQRLFLSYAKQWWKEFLSLQSGHKNRLVKIFAQDENGTNRLVCNYVRPIRANRLLETSAEVAWFTSLFETESSSSLTSSGNVRVSHEFWLNLDTILRLHNGDTMDHAVLLCSLLIGVGFNAYACLGTKANGAAHAWVLTIDSKRKVCFWEPSTACRTLHTQLSHHIQQSHSYSTVGCIFSNTEFYANCQPTDSVSVCDFDVNNVKKWKPMSKDAISTTKQKKWDKAIIELSPPTINAIQASNELEKSLKKIVAGKRQDEGLSTQFDENLTHMLSPGLSCYENSRKLGIDSDLHDFHEIIFNYVPNGYSFKGYPIRNSHRNAKKIFNNASRSSEFKDILYCKGDSVRLAVRARVYTYAENLTSVWVMFSAIYR